MNEDVFSSFLQSPELCHVRINSNICHLTNFIGQSWKMGVFY